MIKKFLKENKWFMLVGFLLALSLVIGVPMYSYGTLEVLWYSTAMKALTIVILVMYSITFAVILALIFGKKTKKNNKK